MGMDYVLYERSRYDARGKKMTKIYFLPPLLGKVSRDFLLIRQGLANNRRVELIEDKDSCDFIFAHYAGWAKRIINQPNLKLDPAKLIFFDYSDPPLREIPVGCKAYFKRSWVVRPVANDFSERVPIPRPDNWYPITVAIMDQFIIDEKIERDIDVLCTLRVSRRHPNRMQVLDFLKGLDINGTKHVGQFNNFGRVGFSRAYNRYLKRGKLAITCMPGLYDGDFRTWEAFASGALVFVDRQYTPMEHPLIDGEHCIFYTVTEEGLKELGKKIRYFVANKVQTEKIARQGYEFTMKYHRASNRIDEILNVILK